MLHFFKTSYIIKTQCSLSEGNESSRNYIKADVSAGKSVADPGFLTWVVPTRKGCTNLLFSNVFAKNCMKEKEIGPKVGSRITSAPLYLSMSL